jgi:septal ring factor EnvC (AmiA/AmiB activator)
MNTIKIEDTINADGSVTRVTTTNFDNGDIDVRTITLTPAQYQIQAVQIQQQIDQKTQELAYLQDQQATIQTNVEQVKTNVSQLKKANPVQKI